MRFSNLIIILSGLLLFANMGLSQKMSGKRTTLKLAGQYYENKDFPKAIDAYHQVINADHEHQDAAYGLAQSYRGLRDYESAQKWYIEVAKTGGDKYPELRYYLGQCMKMMGQYRTALKQFNIFLKQRPDVPLEFFVKANHERNGVLLAIDQSDKEAGDYEFKLLPAPVNTEAADIAMYAQADSGLMVLTSRGTSEPSTIKFRNENGTWLRQLIPFSGFGFEGLESSLGQFDGQGKTFYLAIRPGDQNTWRLTASTNSGDFFGYPQLLPDRINSRLFNSTDPTTTQMGDTLVFASDRPGGYGGYDLWYSVVNSKGEWKTPINFGEVFNTDGDERFPFYYGRERMLFFSSNGHIGYGEMDIYFSSHPFTEPEIVNIGAPFNSGYNDRGLILGHENGFLSSDRQGGLGSYDIYIFKKAAEEQGPGVNDINAKGIVKGKGKPE